MQGEIFLTNILKLFLWLRECFQLLEPCHCSASQSFTLSMSSMLHVEIVLETKQPEAETSLVYDVFIRVIKKESASWTSDERKINEINMWSMWSVKTFYGLFVDSWNKGNKYMLVYQLCVTFWLLNHGSSFFFQKKN